MTKKAVEMGTGRYQTGSGGITFDTLRDYAECGVDLELTHSVKGLDMSFKAVDKGDII